MHRTNIYLSDAQQCALDARAAALGTSRSEILRQILDRELNLRASTELDALFLESAAGVAARARQLSSGDPDLDIS
jgi:hypothetical protein